MYAPHPWDALPARPPAPGADYRDALDPLPIEDALRAADLLRQADEKEDEAREIEDEANDLRDDARKLLATLNDEYPHLAEAIEEDPEAFGDEEAVRKAARGGSAPA